MPVVNAIQTAWVGGEFSPKLLARVDLAKYASGAETLENMIVMPWGGARKRGGFAFIGNTKDDGVARLQSFVHSVGQEYVVEFGPEYARFHTDVGTVTFASKAITGATAANPVVITSVGHSYTDGDRVLITAVGGMTELNNREFTVANGAANTFELSGVDGSAYTAYTSGGASSEIVEIVTPYLSNEIDGLNFTQSADTLFIAHPGHPPQTLTRSSATVWAIADSAIVNGPFRDPNTDDAITLYLSGGSATAYGTYAEGDTGITMTASSSLFSSDHVGSLWRLYMNDGGSAWSQLIGDLTIVSVNRLYENAGNVYALTVDSLASARWTSSMQLPTHTRGAVNSYSNGDTADYVELTYIHDGSVIVEITGFTSDTVVTVTIVRNHAPEEVIGSGNATSFWEEGAFSTVRGWPSKIALYEERLWFANTTDESQTVWGSRTGAFLDFLDGGDDDDAITFTIASEQVDQVQWISGGRVMSIGTTDGEYIATAETTTKALTPADITVRRQTRYGSANNIAPERIGDVVMFAQRYGKNTADSKVIREHSYAFENDSYLGRNVTILSDHVTGTGITKLAYQASPWSLLWANRADGQLASLTYEKDQEVLAWHRHIVGGVSDASNNDAIVESIATIPGDFGDDLWVVTQRYVDSGTVRHIERGTTGLEDGGAIADCLFLDGHLVYSGSSTATITGLWHLRGETVRVFHSGADQGEFVISSTGVLTLGSAVTYAAIGYGFTAKILGLRIEAGVASGTAQGKRKRISEATLRLYESYGGSIGGEASNIDALDYAGETGSSAVALYTGDIRVEWPDGWSYDGRYYIEHSEAYPFVATGLIQEVRGSG